MNLYKNTAPFFLKRKEKKRKKEGYIESLERPIEKLLIIQTQHLLDNSNTFILPIFYLYENLIIFSNI